MVSVGVVALGVGYLAANAGRESIRPGRMLTRGMQLGLAKSSPRRVFWVAVVLCVISMAAFALYAPKVGLHSLHDLLSSRKRFVVENGHVLVYGYYRFLVFQSGTAFILVAYVMIRSRISLRSRLGLLASRRYCSPLATQR